MNKRINDLEFRMAPRVDGNLEAEIICWFPNELGTPKEYCYTLAFWVKNSEGYNLEFIGSRPLDPDLDQSTLFALFRYGQKIMDALFDIEDYIRELK